MSQSPADEPLMTVDTAVGLFMATTIRRFASAYLFIVWIMMALSTLRGFEVIDLSFGERLALALVLTVVNAWALFTPWTELAGTPRGQRWMEFYALIHTVIYSTAIVVLSDSAAFPLALIVVGALGAIYARPPAVLALAVLPVTATVVHAALKPELANFMTVTRLAILLIVIWLTWTAGRAHRRTLETAIAAHGAATEHARQLGIVANSMRSLQELEPSTVLQALVDATEQLGWDAAGLYVPSTPGGAEYGLGAHRNLDQEIVEGPQEPLGIFGEVTRTGAPIAWEDYHSHADANQKYAGVTASAAGAPILIHGVQRGALVTSNSTPRTISKQDLETLELLASQAGRALEIADEYARQQQTVAELERVNALKQDFLATVSHELRTPLAVVLGMAETMDRKWDEMEDELRRTMTTRMHTNAAGLEHVIEALLDFSRLERGIVQPRRLDVALLDLVDEVVGRLTPLTEQHDVAVAPGPLAGRGEAFADPLLIERVVENLVVNACRHTPPGTAVRVLVLHDGPNAVVEIADNGPGIPPEEVERLGERFFRGGDPNTRSTRGLGLGLAFCREVLAMHDSALEIDSVVGEGTRFRFALARGRTGDR